MSNGNVKQLCVRVNKYELQLIEAIARNEHLTIANALRYCIRTTTSVKKNKTTQGEQ